MTIFFLLISPLCERTANGCEVDQMGKSLCSRLISVENTRHGSSRREDELPTWGPPGSIRLQTSSSSTYTSWFIQTLDRQKSHTNIQTICKISYFLSVSPPRGDSHIEAGKWWIGGYLGLHTVRMACEPEQVAGQLQDHNSYHRNQKAFLWEPRHNEHKQWMTRKSAGESQDKTQ